MKKLLYSLLAVAAICAVSSCKSAKIVDRTLAPVNFSVTCLGTDLDGTQTLRAWGKGKNRKQAVEQARKNAVRAVIFKGIVDGTGECNKRPLVAEVNAEEKYESYFNRFFADGGDFKQFTTLEDEKHESRIKATNDAIENYGIVVRVDRAGLRQQLINDGIIKQ